MIAIHPLLTCSKCGGKYVLINHKCLNCYGDFEGPLCNSDSCPAFGIGTEERCRCANPPRHLPKLDFTQLSKSTIDYIASGGEPAGGLF